jgi:LysR substrate binding domain-containing protein
MWGWASIGSTIQRISEFSSELVRSVMAGELNLALVTAPPENSQITTAAFAQAPLYAALPQTHAAAQKKDITLQDLAKDDWILFARRAHPVVHDAIMEAARREGIAPKHAHDATSMCGFESDSCRRSPGATRRVPSKSARGGRGLVRKASDEPHAPRTRNKLK